MSSPTQRTIAELKKRGYTAHIVEKWNSFAKIRQDFGGFADILAYKPGEVGVLAIQCTSDNGGNVAARVDKMKDMPNIKTWLKSGNRFQVWGWGLRGAHGERKLWTLRMVPFQMTSKGEPAHTPVSKSEIPLTAELCVL